MSPQEEQMKKQLESIGVQVKVQTFTGDSSYPTEYELRYSFIRVVEPTIDMAVSEFIEKLLPFVPVEKA